MISYFLCSWRWHVKSGIEKFHFQFHFSKKVWAFICINKEFNEIQTWEMLCHWKDIGYVKTSIIKGMDKSDFIFINIQKVIANRNW